MKKKIKNNIFFLKLRAVFNISNDWKNNEYFDAEWKKRIEKMSIYIENGEVVTDLGCGQMWLKKYIKNNTYYPVDYTRRGRDTVICDFNKYQFPNNKSNVAFVSGCLEYIEDVNWFVEKISETNDKCILSYCTTEYFPNKENRISFAWKNHFSKNEIISLFKKNYFYLKSECLTKTNNQIFLFEK